MKGRRLRRPLLKFEIEEANKNTNSASAAARYLDVSFKTYKKYAELYGLYEEQKNIKGIGVAKGFSKSVHSTKLKDIFENKHPKYPLQRLRWRMIRRGLIKDECSLCGFSEKRITDGKTPLLLIFKDEHGDYSPSNLITLCYNCCFLTRNAPLIVNRRSIERSFKEDTEVKPNSFHDPTMSVELVAEPENDLSDEEILQLKREIDEELGRT